jgi:hypothetical protein
MDGKRQLTILELTGRRRFVARLDSRDLIEPGALPEVLQIAKSPPAIKFCRVILRLTWPAVSLKRVEGVPVKGYVGKRTNIPRRLLFLALRDPIWDGEGDEPVRVDIEITTEIQFDTFLTVDSATVGRIALTYLKQLEVAIVATVSTEMLSIASPPESVDWEPIEDIVRRSLFNLGVDRAAA